MSWSVSPACLTLGYVAFYAVGAYTWSLLASAHFNLHYPFWVLLPLRGLPRNAPA